MKELQSETYIEQVEDGFEYKGHVHFGELYKFEYKLKCNQNLGKLDELAINNLEDATKQIHINIKNSKGELISQWASLFPLFQGMILPLAIEFYEDPRTRLANSPESREMDRMLENFGGSKRFGKFSHILFDADKLESLLAPHRI